jgi:hypothetical protein
MLKVGLLLMAFAAQAVRGADVPQWRFTELDFEAQRAYANPYADVTLTATFTGPQGQTVVREAFWRGGSRWTVRFAPTAVGEWRWRTVCSSPDDAGLHGREGTLMCAAYDGPLPIYRRGFLRVSENRRHFCHADGTPFFWLGDTHWQMPDTERVDACNHPEHGGGACPYGGQFQHLAANRKAKGFTVYQTYPHAESPHWWKTRFTQIDPARFDAVFDAQMNHLAEQGYVIALGVGHFASSTVSPPPSSGAGALLGRTLWRTSGGVDHGAGDQRARGPRPEPAGGLARSGGGTRAAEQLRPAAFGAPVGYRCRDAAVGRRAVAHLVRAARGAS